MPDITALIQNRATNPWLYLPFAVLLGALCENPSFFRSVPTCLS